VFVRKREGLHPSSGLLEGRRGVGDCSEARPKEGSAGGPRKILRTGRRDSQKEKARQFERKKAPARAGNRTPRKRKSRGVDRRTRFPSSGEDLFLGGGV